MSHAAELTVLGAITVDSTAIVSRLPKPGESLTDATLIRSPGGKGANQAAAVAKLGGRVEMIGAVGPDADGAMCLESLERNGVDVSAVQTADSHTGVALIFVDGDGENAVVVAPGASALIDHERIQIGKDTALLTQLEIAHEVVEAVVRQTDGFVAMNLSPVREIGSFLKERVDLFIVNEHEYALSPWLAKAKLVALTVGAEGAMLLREGIEVAKAPGVKVEVVSTVGAGDAFAAALTLSLLRGLPDEEALRKAVAVGAHAVTDPHSQPKLDLLESY